MRIVIDLQGAQTESRFRGIGRYSLSIAKAIARNRGEHEVIIALSGLFPDTIEDIRIAFDDILPQENIKVWFASGPVKECEIGNDSIREVAEVLREGFLESLNPDIILITSLFEGFVDNAVTSIKKFDKNTKIAVILYDLIPYIHQDKYLINNVQYAKHYLEKIEHLKKSDLFLGISQSSLNEAIHNLGINPNKLINISSAVDENFLIKDISNEKRQIFFNKYNISKKTIVYTPGGFDIRKNFDNLIKAYAILPEYIKKFYQLVIVSKVDDGHKIRLLKLAKDEGLKANDLILTGYVSDDELISFYIVCDLFVFPSIHEGFGLPVLEAMNCGAIVIGSNTTSIPEVIGCTEALFDPYDVESIKNKIQEGIENETLQKRLRKHNKVQVKKFSWDESAKILINSFEENFKIPNIVDKVIHKNKLAYFSPLQPQRSGISDYSAELLPYLNEYYDIILIVDEETCQNEFFNIKFEKQNLNWFLENYQLFDRILYQIGNNPFHTYMLDALNQIPGVIVLHDFFLSGLYAYEETIANKNNFWSEELYTSHGYKALIARDNQNIEKVKLDFPVNFTSINKAMGVIAHSNFSKDLFFKYYGINVSNEWTKIPLLRVSSDNFLKVRNRKELNLTKNDFIICSFGFLDFTKLNHRLIMAFYQSKLSKLLNCKLIFVGENNASEYGKNIKDTIKKYKLTDNVVITGWVDENTFKDYLSISDVTVQLRTTSRGETSAAVLDSMNYGCATIINANGSMSELPNDSVYMINDNFEDVELIEVLEKLYDDEECRKLLGKNAKEAIKTQHDPAKCALKYYNAIENYYSKKINNNMLFSDLSKLINSDKEQLIRDTAIAIDKTFKNRIIQKQILFDVSTIARNDLRTGIERVVRSQLLELFKNIPHGYRIEPVYLTNEGGFWHYKYARQYTLSLHDISDIFLNDDIVSVNFGDIFYCADFYRDGIIAAAKVGLYKEWKNIGVSIFFILYDLLPILKPKFFPKNSDKYHSLWLQSIICVANNVICISESVSNELKVWIEKNHLNVSKKMHISHLHLGADIESSNPTKGISIKELETIDTIKNKISFLIVGTIEPRKGHLQVIETFTKLWQDGIDVNLVIVGKEGWKGLPESERKTIPEIINKIKNHFELDKRLFWLDSISDEYLEKVYEASHCLIFPSEGEGFGLPLIEAAQKGLPIIARDIPVFREVAGDFAYYFENDNNPLLLIEEIKEWIKLYKENNHVKSSNMKWLTWEKNVLQLLKIIGKTNEK